MNLWENSDNRRESIKKDRHFHASLLKTCSRIKKSFYGKPGSVFRFLYRRVHMRPSAQHGIMNRHIDSKLHIPFMIALSLPVKVKIE
jgi:hypothetical protein